MINKTTRRKPKRRTIKAWGGFTDDKLYSDVRGADYGGERLCAVYANQVAARKAFQDVRRIEISWQEVRRG